LLEADFFSIDLTAAFCGTLKNGLYLNRHGPDVLYLQRNKRKPWLFALTGVVRLEEDRSKRVREFWKEVFEVRDGVIDCRTFEIAPDDAGGIEVHQLSVLSKPLSFQLVSEKGSGVPEFLSDHWWEGDKFIMGAYVLMNFVCLDPDEERFVASIKLGNLVIGPFDVKIVCQRFFIVDGQADAFWVFLQGNKKMATYNQFYAETRPHKKTPQGEFARFDRGWMRFEPKKFDTVT